MQDTYRGVMYLIALVPMLAGVVMIGFVGPSIMSGGMRTQHMRTARRLTLICGALAGFSFASGLRMLDIGLIGTLASFVVFLLLGVAQTFVPLKSV